MPSEVKSRSSAGVGPYVLRAASLLHTRKPLTSLSSIHFSFVRLSRTCRDVIGRAPGM